MKKLLLFVAACMFSTVMFAQTLPVNFGLHAGFVSTKIDAKAPSLNDVKESADNGMMLGAFLRVNIKKWYIQPELNYVSRKSKVSYTLAGNNVSAEIKTKSLDVPILLGYKIVKLPMFKLRAFAGPVASFTLDDKATILSTIQKQSSDLDFKGAVWNGKVGAGIDVWKLSLDVDYEFGLSDVSDEFLKKNKMFNVTLGFRLF